MLPQSTYGIFPRPDYIATQYDGKNLEVMHWHCTSCSTLLGRNLPVFYQYFSRTLTSFSAMGTSTLGVLVVL